MDEAWSDQIQAMRVGLRATQQLQSSYDAVGWRISDPNWAKARHIMLHLVKVTAELARVIERVEHQNDEGVPPTSDEFVQMMLEHERIPADLVFNAAQLASLMDRELGRLLLDLWKSNAEIFASESKFVEIELDD